MPPHYILRIDDVAPNMNWETFRRVETLLRSYGVRPLVGVIPDNGDPELLKHTAFPGDFWSEMRRLRDDGWKIAMHGYQHRYVTPRGGMLGLSGKSEFAGLPYEEQRTKLERGLEVLRANGLGTDTFMAPSHSFDSTTERALRDVGFRFVTDGFALFPFLRNGLLFVPQIFAAPRSMPFGVFTFLVHPNTMRRPAFDRLRHFLEEHRERFVDFDQAAASVSPGRWNQWAGKVMRTLGTSLRSHT